MGIDIGNTRIKLALIREEELVSVYDWPNEIPGWIDRGPIKYMHDVMECVEAHLAGLGISSVEGVGVAWFGDVRDGHPLTLASDIAAWSHPRWINELRRMPDVIQGRMGCSVTFRGDVESIGESLGVEHTFHRTYLLVLGTSTGGAFFGEDGCYQHGVNLVSRMIVDLDDEAPKHSATNTPGTLQQYSASYGIARALNAEKRSGSGGRCDGAYLSTLLASQNDEEARDGRQCVETLGSWLLPAIVDLQCTYGFEQILLAGGNTRPALGNALLQSLRQQWQTVKGRFLKFELLSAVKQWPAGYEVAVAAARLSRFR